MKKYSRSKFRIMARQIALEAVRNTLLEDFHCGTSPSSKVGDFSDVKVVSPYGEIPYKKLSRLSDSEMRTLMLEIEEKLRISLWFWFRKHKDENLLSMVEKQLFGEHGISWDDPTLNKKI